MRNSIAPQFKVLGRDFGEICRCRGEGKRADKVNFRFNLD